MISQRQCRICGASLDEATTSGGLCPVCLLRAGLTPEPESEGDSVERGHAVLPRIFGPYELIEEIGRGGMGVVYAARQSALSRTVAVKLLLSGAYASETALERFRIEAAAAAGLQHPNIVEIHDYGEWEGQPYYVMDLVSGRNLAQVCDGRPLNAARAATILRDLADAVHYAHQQGILHRDLKPSNVLMDDRDRPRITDFGLARRVDDASGVTQSGMIMGSPGYASPEQAGGLIGEVGVRSDVYGLGAILYHLLTGRAPFNAATPTETLRLVLETDPPAPRLLNPAVPRDLETVCLKCLAKEPAGRYAAAADVRDELQRFLEHRPIRARPPSLFYRARKFVRRYRTGVAAVAAVIVALAAGLTMALLGYRRAVEQQQATDAARARSQEMVTFIMQDLQPQLQTLGRRKAMIDAAKAAVRYFEQLAPELRDRATMRAHATALDLLVEAYGVTSSRTLSSDPAEGLTVAAQAAALWRQLAASDPTDVNAMVAALNDEVLALTADPRPSDMEKLAKVRELLARYRHLEELYPENDDIRIGMCRPLVFLAAKLADRVREPMEAVDLGREAVQRAEDLLAKRPGDFRLHSVWIWALNALGHALADRDESEAARQNWEEALANVETLLDGDATNLQALELAACMAMRLMWHNAGARKGAVESIRVARQYLATLIALDPEDPEWRYRDLMAIFMEGVAWASDRHYDEAMRSTEQALAGWRLLAPQAHDIAQFYTGQNLATYAGYAAKAGDRALAMRTLERLQNELSPWVNAAETDYERSRRRFYYLYWQDLVVVGLGNWNETERLSREMLAETDRCVADHPETRLLSRAYRTAALGFLGFSLLRQGRATEAVPLLDEVVAQMRSLDSMAPFSEFPIFPRWAASQALARALQQTGDTRRVVELLEWAFAKYDSFVKEGSLLGGRMQLAQCAWQLAQALDPDDPVQAGRRQEVLTRALELLDDPETAPRLTPEERDLRAKVAEALRGPPGT